MRRCIGEYCQRENLERSTSVSTGVCMRVCVCVCVQRDKGEQTKNMASKKNTEPREERQEGRTEKE